MKFTVLLTILLSAFLCLNISAQTLGDETVMNAVVMPKEVKSNRKQPVRTDLADTGENIKIDPQATPQIPQLAGTCETAGPIEVESSGGTLAAVPTPYATLAAAFTAINGATLHLGTITIDVCGDTIETGTATLNQTAGVNSVAISPAGGAARTISGAIAAGSPLVDLNGADNVTINGLNTGGNTLTISNTTVGTTAGTSTIRFIADATTNTITNTTILGSSASTLATVAGTVLFSTGTTTGNDANTISNCNIGPAGANSPSKAIMASGTSATIENDNVQITGNNIFDFFLPTGGLSGINILTGNEGWTISGNKFYQTTARVFTASASRYSAITISNTTGSFTISNNIIGFANAAGTGTTTISGSSNEIRGLDLPSVNTTPATVVQGNTISGISQTSSRASTTTGSSAFIGMLLGSTQGLFTITGNTMGSLDGSSGIAIAETSTTTNTAPVIGIYDFSFTNTVINSNNFGSFTISSGGTGTTVGFRGILVSGTVGQLVTLNNNSVGGSVAGSITDSIVGSYGMYGIQVATASISATGNIVRNFTGSSTGAGLIVMSGISYSGATATVANTFSQNIIFNFTNASGAAANSIYAMSLAMPTIANQVVSRNLIYGLSLTSTATGTQLWGISGGATGTTTYQNNMIRLGTDANNASVTQPSSVIGIRDAAGSTNNYYNNSVYISGTGVLATPAAVNTYCFLSSNVTTTHNVLDNIFFNARSNVVAGGVAHLAVGIGATTTGLTSNYNDLYITGTDGAVGVFNAMIYPTLATYQAATAQEANSLSVDPQFVSTTNLHLKMTSPMINVGTVTPFAPELPPNVVTAVADDFDGQTRDAMPDIGADEYFAPTVPTAATVNVGGRVLTSDGRAISGARVYLTDAQGNVVIRQTNSAGYYRFTEVGAGASYILTVTHKSYTFQPPQLLLVNEENLDVNFVAVGIVNKGIPRRTNQDQ